MKSHPSLDSIDLQHLQNLCDECKHAIASYDTADKIGRAMQDACEACQHVRSRLPALVELCRDMREFNRVLDASLKK